MVIETDDLRIALGGRQILRGINLSLRKGEVVGLLGPNGAGKSTLMRALNGQVRGQGTVRVMGRDLAELSLHDRARNIAYLAQDRLIAWQITVDRLVGLGRLPWRSRLGRGDPDDRRICGEAVDMMDIAHLLDRRATELSGGEQARVLVARAIAQDTPVLLADEPTSGLDPAHQFHLMAALRSLAGKGRCILVSVHDLTLAARWCDRVIVVDNGCVVAAGRPLDVMTPGLLDDVFGILARIETDECGLVLAPVGLSGDR